MRLLDIGAVAACERAKGRCGINNLRRLVKEALAPTYSRSPLENSFAEFCREHLADLPTPLTILDEEVDAYWPHSSYTSAAPIAEPPWRQSGSG